MMSSSTKCNSNVLQVQHMVHYNVQHQGMLHVFRVYLGATIAALFQQIAFPLGIFSLIIGGLLVLYTQLSLTFISFAPFIPILTGLFFLIIWWQVKDVFCAVRIENYPRL